MKSDWPLSRDRRGLIFSEKLLNIKHKCSMRHCTSIEISTGWLCIDLDGNGYGENKFDFFVGFDCPRDGLGGRWTPELQLLINEVIQDAARSGFDLKGEIRKKREEYKQRVADYNSKKDK